MITIRRGSEPKELKRVRHWRLAAQYLARDTGSTPPEITGYEKAFDALYQAQHGKCCYCERAENDLAQPVEHFRPKDGADRRLKLKDPANKQPGYWWLSWTWENLFFACHPCNTGIKGTLFPIKGAPLVERDFDLHNERALLIDPAREDPRTYIRWQPKNRKAWRVEDPSSASTLRWEPQPIIKPKGEPTIELLRFRGTLSRFVTNHIRSTVWPNFEKTFQAARNNDLPRAQQEWKKARRNILKKDQSFLAATYDAILFFLEQAPITPDAIGIKDPSGSPRRYTCEPPIPPAPAGIQNNASDRYLWHRILACGEHGSVNQKKCLIWELCTRNPMKEPELETSLPILSLDRLKALLAELVTDKSIRLVGDQYVSP